MNLLEELGKVAGAVIAEQGIAKLDPDANFLEKAAAAIAGYEGTKIAEEQLGAVIDNYQTNANTADDADNSDINDNNDNNDETA